MLFTEEHIISLKKRIKGKMMHKLIDQLPTILEEAWLKQFPELESLAACEKITVSEYVFNAVKEKILQEQLESLDK